jgi:4-hydroxyphenylpyruvate dioxygenase
VKREQLAINTVSLGGQLPDILAGCAAGGFRNVEFALGQVHAYLKEGHDVGAVTQLLQQHQLRCIGGFISGLEAFSDAEAQSANHASLIENARLLSELGGGAVQSLVVGTDDYRTAGEVEDPIEGYAKALAKVAGQTAPLGVNVLLEFNWGAIKSLPAAVEIARRSGAPNAGVLFDPAHFHCTPTKSEDLTPENVAFIRHVHVNNMRRKPAELSNCNSDRLLPDDPAGALDVQALFAKIEAGGYSGFFSIEMFSDELWALPAAEAAGRMWDSMAFLI